MARSKFGGTSQDGVFSTLTFGGKQLLALARATLTFWDAETGGTRYTDLLDLNGNPTAAVMTRDLGQVPVFWGPDGVTEMWAEDGDGRRALMVAQGRQGERGPVGPAGGPIPVGGQPGWYPTPDGAGGYEWTDPGAAFAAKATQDTVETGRLSPAALSATYGRLLAPVPGEATVVDAGYPVGDIRRYGVAPGDMTTAPTVLGNRVISAINANAAAGIVTHFPTGLYNCGLNVNVSNARLRLEEGAEFSGIIHIGGNSTEISNIEVQGPLTTYDRFGVYLLDGFKFDTARCKSDAGVNTQTPGSKGRGVHIYNGATNILGRSIVVDDIQGDSTNVGAAVAVDGFGNNPSNLTVELIHVKKSDTHGVYLTGLGHNIGIIRVDEWGATGYSDSVGLMDADSLAQSQEVKGVWINRCGAARINRIEVNQGAGTRANALYDVMVDETGINALGAVSIGSIEVRNSTGASRGVSFGDATYPTTGYCVAHVESVRITNSLARTAVAGFGCLNVKGPADVSISSARLLNVDTFDGYHQGANAKAKIGLLDVGAFKGRMAYIAGKSTIDVLRGTRTAVVSGTSNTVEIFGASASASRLGVVDITVSGGNHAARGLLINQATDVTVGKLVLGSFATGGGVLNLTQASRAIVREISMTGPGASGTGIIISSSTGLLLERGTVTGYATGVDKAGTNGGIAVGMTVSGNTTNTTLAAGTFTELGNSGFQLAA